MTRVTLVRHSQSAWNAEGRWQGWADPPLSARGEDEARAAGGALASRSAPPDLMATSDLRRARRSAELLGAHLVPRREILVDADLREYDAGDWTGLRRREIESRWPDMLAAWDTGELDHVPGGERSGPFLERLIGALRRLQTVVPDGAVLAVSHGRAVHVVATALGAPAVHIDHLTGWVLDIVPGRPVMLLDGLRLGSWVDLRAEPGPPPAPRHGGRMDAPHGGPEPLRSEP